jgi:hypothetical protein
VGSIAGLTFLAGMVIILDQSRSGRFRDIADGSRLLRGILQLLKAFLQSPVEKFAMLIQY